MTVRHPVAVALIFSIVGVSVLWLLDVVVHLGLAEKILLGTPPLSRGSDFLGLMLADAAVAALVGTAAAAGGWVLARLLRSDDPIAEALALLVAGLGSVVLLAGIEIHWSDCITPLPLITLAILGGTTLWWRQRRRQRPHGSLAVTALERSLVACSVVAGGLRGAAALESGDLVPGVVAAVLVGLAAAIHRFGGTAGAHGSLRGALLAAPLAFAVMLATASVVAPAAKPAPPRGGEVGPGAPPPIALIVLDTVRADRIPIYGYPRETMPRLTRWSRGGVVAERALSTAGWTAPSHASIFSGEPVSVHGIHYSATSPRLHTDARGGIGWLPQRLAELGYSTLAVTANPQALVEGIEGFDRVLSPDRKEWHRSSVGALASPLFPWLRPASEDLRWRLPYADAEQIVKLVERIARPGDSPAFLFVNFLDAHSPYAPPAEALRELDLAPARLFDRYLTHRPLTRSLASLPPTARQVLGDLYDGELRGLDRQLGRLLSWIDEVYGANALVVVTSDHGEELGEEGRVGHEYGLAQTLLHVPLIVRAPWLEPGRLPSIVTLRRLSGFIHAAARGERPGIRDLAAQDAYGAIAERYPSRYNAESLGSAYDRAWVARIEGDAKVVGPSAHGLQAYDVGRFDIDTPDAGSDASERLAKQIDAYWTRYQDRRETPEAGGAPSRDERERLRSLGYAE